MNNKLEPVNCGCGGEAKVISYLCKEYCKMAYYVRCENCGTETDDLHSEAEAVEVWNRAMGNRDKSSQVERTAKVENIEVEWGDDEYVHDRMGDMYHYGDCGNCGQTVSHNQKYCHECGARLEWE